MASTYAKAVRRAEVLGRLSAALNIKQADLHTHARGDAEMALIMTLERVADVVDALITPATKTATKKDAVPASDPEKQLEAETGHDVVKTGDNPPTYVETDKAAPKQAGGDTSNVIQADKKAKPAKESGNVS